MHRLQPVPRVGQRALGHDRRVELAGAQERVVSWWLSERSTPADRSFRQLAERVAAAGEPFLSYLSPADVEFKLREAGYATVGFLVPEEAKSRYFSPPSPGLPPPASTGIAYAIR